MSKATDVADLLGETSTPAKASKAKKTAPVVEAKAPAKDKKAAPVVEAPAKASKAKKAAPVADDSADLLGTPAKKVAAKKTPISFAEGERQALADAVTAHFKRSKKAVNSRDLAFKLETETRKLRVVLYALATKGVVALTPGESKVAGMSVAPA